MSDVFANVFWGVVIFGPIVAVESYVRAKIDFNRRAKAGMLLWASSRAKSVGFDGSGGNGTPDETGDARNRVVIIEGRVE